MELEYKPDFEKARKRMEAFWNGEILDRPLINITSPNGKKPRHIPPPDTMEKKVLDFNYRLDAEEEKIRCTYFGGEAIPLVWPDFGPSFTAACLGGILKIANANPEIPVQGNIWSNPVIDDWEKDFDKIGFAAENIWWKRGLEFVKLARERGKGKYCQIMLDVDGGGDTCADLRGPERLYLDLYENRDWIYRLLNVVRQGNSEIVKRIYDEVAPYQGGCISTGYKLWSPGRFYNMRNDFAYLIKPALFREIFLNPMVKESETIDYTMFHTHTEDYQTNREGRLAWLDVVLSVPKVQGVEWHAWEDFKKIIDAGKFVVTSIGVKQISDFVNAMGPKYLKRIWIISSAESREEAETVIKMLSRK